MTVERVNGKTELGHRFRYHLARGFADVSDYVLDAACGTGYGREILRIPRYRGVDRDPPYGACFTEVDLSDWSPAFRFDVFIGFETLEHLADYESYLATAKCAAKWIIMSVPVVPTKHINEWHLQDFAPGDLRGLLEDNRWEHFQTVQQPQELAEITVMRRRA